MNLQRICVFTGAHRGNRVAYSSATADLAHELIQRDITILYGGGSTGLMGTLAETALAEGGRVIGVIPEFLCRREIAHPALSELHVVGSMHERKALMAELADGFIALPGGFGTLEELLEISTLTQLGVQSKAVGLLNVDDYFRGLLTQLDHGVMEGFIRPKDAWLLQVARTPTELLNCMHAFKPRRRSWVNAP